jgi:hypothetical protein
MVLVGADGKVSDCVPTEWSGFLAESSEPQEKKTAPVDERLCAYLMTVPMHKMLGKRKENGPVRYVRQVNARLTG